ncbi:MAG: glutamine-hydrolyzing GMP synthase [Acholeplasma sp.]|nr:glutamine-hydrolyzing GMP synthase [Acholeplasma sp.]
MTDVIVIVNDEVSISNVIVNKLNERGVLNHLRSYQELSDLNENVKGIITYKDQKIASVLPVLYIKKLEDIDDQVDVFLSDNKIAKDYTVYTNKLLKDLKEELKDKKVILGLSGGVDSSVTAALINKAIGRNLTCILVDHGLLRKNEVEEIKSAFAKNFDLNLKVIDASSRFLSRLKRVTDPEKKRKIIGNEFVEVFEETKLLIKDVSYLAQGTIYPDIIESGKKQADVIKSHHNVGGLPSKMELKLVEPLKYLYKNEVRLIGEILGLPKSLVNRQPFPGPGLGIRLLGEITKERLEVLKNSDFIFRDEIRRHHLDNQIWQYFTVLTPLKTVGVVNGKRTYEDVLVIRAVNSLDGMSAKVFPLPYDVLETIVERIIKEVKGVGRVVYDVTPKPLGTIEWE